MKYQDYVKIGCGIIGSGAIESAHRTLVQKRMKQSGQRRSCKVSRNMPNLRVVRKNNDWNKIIGLIEIKIKAKKAACLHNLNYCTFIIFIVRHWQARSNPTALMPYLK